MYDFHIHSCFSDDSNTPIEDIVKSAIQFKLRGICITDHIDIDYPNNTVSFIYDYNKYIEEINNMRIKYNKKLRILAGVEFGVQSHIINKANIFLTDKSYDFIIASLHALNNKELYMGKFLENSTVQEGIADYFKEMYTCIREFDNFDVIGHFDVIRRYIPDSDIYFKFKSYQDYIEACLKAIIQKGKGIELNTSSYGLSDFHPIPDILRLYKALGGEIITLGSDSHKPDTLGRSFTKAINHIYSLGFKYYTIYDNRIPEFIKID